MIRLIVQEQDTQDLPAGAPARVSYHTFDVDAPALESFLTGGAFPRPTLFRVVVGSAMSVADLTKAMERRNP